MLFHGVHAVEHPKTVLFADDSSVARKQISMTMEKMGLDYISVNNGKDAWDRLQEIKARAEEHEVPVNSLLHLILTDVEMPEMDGYVLTKKIKSDGAFAGIPVVMHSSLSAEANINLGRAVGADYYVAKFNPVELNKMVRKALGEDDI